VFKESLPQKINSQAFRQILESIQILHSNGYVSGCFDGAIAITARMQAIIREPDPDPGDVLVHAMRLGFEYSKAHMPLRADLVYDFAASELQSRGYDGMSQKREIISEFENYAHHCWRTENNAGLKEASRYLEPVAILTPSPANIEQ
jgi:hypothetical protein